MSKKLYGLFSRKRGIENLGRVMARNLNRIRLNLKPLTYAQCIKEYYYFMR
jgi:hypothetical protein